MKVKSSSHRGAFRPNLRAILDTMPTDPPATLVGCYRPRDARLAVAGRRRALAGWAGRAAGSIRRGLGLDRVSTSGELHHCFFFSLKINTKIKARLVIGGARLSACVLLPRNAHARCCRSLCRLQAPSASMFLLLVACSNSLAILRMACTQRGS